MSDLKPTYEDLLKKIEYLSSENKKLRLRPSVDSTDANLLDFMKVKSQLAHDLMNTDELSRAVAISIKYLLKINNIHAAAIFRCDKQEEKIQVLNEQYTPKKLIKEFTATDCFIKYESIVFPSQSTFYSSYLDKENFENVNAFSKYLKSFRTILIIPIIEGNQYKYSLLILSKKIYRNSRLFKVVYENIQIQLKSSFNRFINQNTPKLQAENIESFNSEKENDFEKMNLELIHQIRDNRREIQNINEELHLYRSIIDQQKDIIVRINKDGQILYHNPSFSDLKKLNDSGSNHIAAYLGDGDFPGLNRILFDFEEGILQVNCEIEVHSDELRWFHFYFSPIKNSRGLIIEIQVVARNIDRILRLERKLSIQKELLLNILHSHNSICLAIDDKAMIQINSRKCQNFTGIPSDQPLNISLMKLLDQNSQNTLIKYIEQSKVRHVKRKEYMVKLRQLDGHYLDYQMLISPISEMSHFGQYFNISLLPA